MIHINYGTDFGYSFPPDSFPEIREGVSAVPLRIYSSRSGGGPSTCSSMALRHVRTLASSGSYSFHVFNLY